MAASSTIDALIGLLRRNGRQPAAAVLAALGVSRPTLARAVATTPGIVRIGKGRATQYALAHDIRGEHQWPLYRLDWQAKVELVGTLLALNNGEFVLLTDTLRPSLLKPPFASGIFPDVPWFLEDLRPAGFLGRTFAHRMADALALPADLMRWNAGHIITALLHGGSAQTGDLILGDAALARCLQELDAPTDAAPEHARGQHFVELARQALAGEAPGSSPGGEQAKFTATLVNGNRRRASIVKFSINEDTAAARRWASLLHCEALAARVLSSHGLPAASCEIVEANGQVFLQSQRFDRTPDVLGRCGFVSLSVIASAFLGEVARPWWQLAAHLQTDGWIDRDNAEQLCRLHWFGALIANSDMHLGNAGLLLTDTLPLRLAPAYDMLPMWLRPSAQGSVAIRDYPIPTPTGTQIDAWRWAAGAACDYWQKVQAHTAVEADLRGFAQRMYTDIVRIRERF